MLTGEICGWQTYDEVLSSVRTLMDEFALYNWLATNIWLSVNNGFEGEKCIFTELFALFLSVV